MKKNFYSSLIFTSRCFLHRFPRCSPRLARDPLRSFFLLPTPVPLRGSFFVTGGRVYLSARVHNIQLARIHMLAVMAVMTQRFEIVPVEGYVGVVDVGRGQVYLMVYYGGRVRAAPLTHPELRGQKPLSALLPLLRFIKTFCKLSHRLIIKQKTLNKAL